MFDARVLLLKRFNFDIDVTYPDYRKFRAESRSLSISEVR